VRVVNLVAQGTIEEGMLSLLGFKRAVFAGVLDGGGAEVVLGGSRLARFMETVEKATGTLRPRPVQSDDAAGEMQVPDDDGAGDGGDDAAREAPSPPLAYADEPLARVLEGGLALFGELARAVRTAHGNGGAAGQAGGWLRLARDPMTHETFLRVRVPDTELLKRALEAAAELVESLRHDRCLPPPTGRHARGE
jgi:hypothetical protein